MKESTVIRLNQYNIKILEEFRQDRIERLSQALNEEKNEVAKSCLMNEIERFKNITLSDLLTECLNNMKYLKEGLIN